MSVILTGRQSGDNPQLVRLLDGLNVKRTGLGRPRQRPKTAVADKAYSHPSTQQAMRGRQVRFISPEKSDQIVCRPAKRSAGGCPLVFDKDVYRGRNVVEQCFARLKQFRGLAISYAKRAAYYAAEVTIAAIVLWRR